MILKSFLLLAFFIYTSNCEPVRIETVLKECLAKYNSTGKDSDTEYLFKYGVYPPGNEYKRCAFECIFKTIDIVDSNSVPDRKKIVDYLERQKARPMNTTDLDDYMDLIFGKCLPPTDTSSPCNIVANFVTCVLDIATVMDFNWLWTGRIPVADLKLLGVKGIYARNVIPAVNSCKRLKNIEKH